MATPVILEEDNRTAIPPKATKDLIPKVVPRETKLDAKIEQPSEEVIQPLEGKALETFKFVTSLTGQIPLTEPRLGFEGGKLPLEEAATKDIEAQMKTVTMDDKLQEAISTGKTIVAGKEYNEEQFNFIMSTPPAKQKIEEQLNVSENISKPNQGQPTPFDRGGKFFVADDSQDAQLTNAKELTHKYLTDIDALLKPYIPEGDLRELVARNFGRGVIDSTMFRLADVGRGTVAGIPQLFGYAGEGKQGIAWHALGTLIDWGSGKSGFLESWNSRAPAMAGYFESVNNFYDDHLKFIPLITVGRAFNAAVDELITKEVEEGRMTPERAKQLRTTIDPITQEETERAFFTDSDAQDLVNLAYNDLSFLGKIVVTGSDVAAVLATGGKKAKATANIQRNIVKKEYDDLVKKGLIKTDKITDKLSEQTKVVQAHNDNIVLNHKYLNLAFYEDAVNSRVASLGDAFVEAKTNLQRIEFEEGIDPGGWARIGFEKNAPARWKQASADVRNTSSAYLRARIGNSVSPYLKETAAEWSKITFMQLAARDILAGGVTPFSGESGLVNMDPLIAEFIGATIGYTGSKPIGSVAGGLYSLTENLLSIPGSSKYPGFLANAADFIIFGKAGILTDKLLEDYDKISFQNRMGRRMNREERQGLRQVMLLYKNSTQEARQQQFEAAQGYNNMIQDALNSVKPFLQKVMKEDGTDGIDEATLKSLEQSINNSMYVTGNMSKLAGLAQQGMFRLNLDYLGRNPNLDDINTFMKTDAMIFAESAVQVLEESISAIGIKTPELDNMVRMIRGARNNFSVVQETLAKKLQQQLKEVKANYGKYDYNNVDEDLLSKLQELDESVAFALKQPFDARQNVIDNANILTSNLAERASDLESYDKGFEYYAAMSRQLEDLVDLKDSFRAAVGREIYAPVKKHFDNPDVAPIDISSFVEKYVGEANLGSIERFFSPAGSFLNTASGKHLNRALRDMVHRTIGKEGIRELRKALLDNGVPRAEVESLTDVQIAIRVQQAGGGNIFKAVNGEELDLMTRQMKEYASKTKNDSLGAVAIEMAGDLDTLLEQTNPEGFKILSNARKEYKAEIFDRERAGNFGDVVKSNRSGPAVSQPSISATSKYQLKYNGQNALDVIRKIANKHLKNLVYADSDTNTFITSREKLTEFINSFSIEFAKHGGPGGRPYFDFDQPLETAGISEKIRGTPEMFNLLAGTMKNSIAATYGLEEAKRLRNLIDTRTGEVGQGGIDAIFSMDYTRLRNQLDVEDAVSVLVKKDGKFFEQPLFTLDELYESAFDLQDMYSKNKTMKQVYDRAGRKLDELIPDEQIAKEATQITVINEAFQTIDKTIVGVTNPDKLYAEFTTSGTGFDARSLVEESAELLSQTQKYSYDEAFDASTKFVKTMVIRGMFNRAGKVVEEGKTIPRFNPITKTFESTPVRAFKSPSQVLSDINDNREKFLQIFTEQELSMLEGIYKVVNSTHQRADKITGQTGKAVTVRGVLGKTYNIARDQVGLGYSMGDLGIRLLEDARIDMYRLLASNPDALRITHSMIMNMPVKRRDIDKMGNYLLNYAITEISALGMDVQYHVDRVKNQFKQEEEEEDEEG